MATGYNIRRDKVEEEQILPWITQKGTQHDGRRCQGYVNMQTMTLITHLLE
jgi:hypothetical protein